MALQIAPATGQQNATQNPQTVPSAPGASTRSGGVQPGTATSLLTSTQGETLHPQTLTTVSLASDPRTVRTTTSSVQPAPPQAHKVNAVWVAIPLVICLVAVVVFWAMSRSAKSTTN